jgi:MinD-like ATPase involved in chromosome partitioning or flagellar assembly
VVKVISLHSFRGGTGKSNITANLAAVIAQAGHRVGVVDTDIQSPGIHTIFQMSEGYIKQTLNDYLWGRCRVQEATYDVTPPELLDSAGRIFLTPASLNAADISRVLHEAYDVRQLKDGFRELVHIFNLDYLLIDTHPGLNEETLLSIAISHILIVVLRPDAQDYQGTSVTLEVARKLSVPHILLVFNKVLPESNNPGEVAQVFENYRRQLRQTYQCPVGTILPLSTELVRLASSGLFIFQSPDDPFAQSIRELGDNIMAIK